ncbi:PRC-barrel domain-containing protein [Roseococcus sp. SYP-B2431]|uniref:PRC-barrel domain-containing protein n=1 Tax=Roseococcus sp. SYP-B2431 TaxID=2496640 RepID=UPI0013F433BF|nr:PRC-barrel domain-containing protein [Roseococcus sp. SYP-B2431]
MVDTIHQPTTADLTEDTDGYLVAAGKVNGVSVYGADRERIGHIEDLMIDKRAGTVEYGVLHFGGFLGLGSKHYAVPWRMLRYDNQLEGFVVDNITKARLDNAPVYEPVGVRDWTMVDNYWGM